MYNDSMYNLNYYFYKHMVDTRHGCLGTKIDVDAMSEEKSVI